MPDIKQKACLISSVVVKQSSLITRLTLLLHRICYIKGLLTFMYKVNREFSYNTIKWYKQVGLDDMNKLIEFIQRYLKKNHPEQFALYCGDSFDC